MENTLMVYKEIFYVYSEICTVPSTQYAAFYM